MPKISIFFGIVVQMYWREHPTAHFYAYYQGFEGLFAIETGQLIAGQMSPGRKRIVKAWTLRHKEELLEKWERIRIKALWKLKHFSKGRRLRSLRDNLTVSVTLSRCCLRK
jgi:Domain of unknown function (DUF4160)